MDGRIKGAIIGTVYVILMILHELNA